MYNAIDKMKIMEEMDALEQSIKEAVIARSGEAATKPRPEYYAGGIPPVRFPRAGQSLRPAVDFGRAG